MIVTRSRWGLLAAAAIISFLVGLAGLAGLMGVQVLPKQRDKPNYQIVEKRIPVNKTVIASPRVTLSVHPSILYNSTRITMNTSTARIPERLFEGLTASLDKPKDSRILGARWEAHLEVAGFSVPLGRGVLTGNTTVNLTRDSLERILEKFIAETGIRAREYRAVLNFSISISTMIAGAWSSPLTLGPSVVLEKKQGIYTVAVLMDRAVVRGTKTVKEVVPVKNNGAEKAVYLGLAATGFTFATLSSVTLGFAARQGRDQRVSRILRRRAYEANAMDLPIVSLANAADVAEIAERTGRPLLRLRRRLCVVVEAVAYCANHRLMHSDGDLEDTSHTRNNVTDMNEGRGVASRTRSRKEKHAGG